MDFLDAAGDVNSIINTYVWYAAIAIILPLGIYFTIRLKGVQITKIPETLRILKKSLKEKADSDSISGFRAFCTTMGTRVGVGNIAGVAAAIVMGGPGTIFWMWIFAIFLAAVTFVENIVGQLFKEKQPDGMTRGGAAYYVKKGLGKPKFAIVMSALLIILGFSFCGVQASQACASVTNAFPAVSPIIVGLAMVLLAGIIFFGGVKRIAGVSAKLVPIMVFCYIGLVIIVLVTNFSSLGGVFATIFSYAFGIQPFVGGGVAMMLLWALKRTVFSTDSGVGVLPHVTASVNPKHPVTVGLIQAFGTFVDIAVCTASGLVIILYTNVVYPKYNFNELGLSEVELDSLKGTPLVSDAFSATFLGGTAPYILTLFLVVFAFSTLITHYITCEANILYVVKKHRTAAVFVLRVSLLTVIFVAAQLSLGVVWDIADSVQGILCSCNLVVLALLCGCVFDALRDYKKQKKNGKDEPVFTVGALSRKIGVTAWDGEESKK